MAEASVACSRLCTMMDGDGSTVSYAAGVQWKPTGSAVGGTQQLPCHSIFASHSRFVSCSALSSAVGQRCGATASLSPPIDNTDWRTAVTNDRRRPERFHAIRCRHSSSRERRLSVLSNSASSIIVTILDGAPWPAGGHACCTFSTADRVARHQASPLRRGRIETRRTFVLPSAGTEQTLPRR